MFERFTDRARQVVKLADAEARRLNHNYIGTEHVLLGMCREGECVGAQLLQRHDLSLAQLRSDVEQITGRGEHGFAGHLPFTVAGKKSMEQALRAALRLGHNFIGSEHLLLGVLAVDDVGAQTLNRHGVTYEETYEAVDSYDAHLTADTTDAAARTAALDRMLHGLAGQYARAHGGATDDYYKPMHDAVERVVGRRAATGTGQEN